MTHRKTHGEITKPWDIHYQAKGKSIYVGLNDSGVLLTSLGMQKLLHVVLTSGGEILDISCHMLETANFRDYIS